MKKIKIFNGTWRHTGHAYVGALSNKHAVELLNKVVPSQNMTLSYLNKYWNKGCWGNSMNGIEPQIGVWIQEKFNDQVKKVI